MSWNHRVLAVQHVDGSIQFQIHEVYYNNLGIPTTYTENPISISGEDIDSIKWQLKHIKKCLKKPILWHGENFPKKYKK